VSLTPRERRQLMGHAGRRIAGGFPDRAHRLQATQLDEQSQALRAHHPVIVHNL
jgi:hypothetical protein